MRPHSPNYTLSSHHYLKLCPRHTGTRASDRNIVMGARREAGGCERHQIFSGNWSVIVKTSPIILSHVTSVDKLNYQRKKVKTENVEFELFHVYYFSVFCTRICVLCAVCCVLCAILRPWYVSAGLWGWGRLSGSLPRLQGVKESSTHVTPPRALG